MLYLCVLLNPACLFTAGLGLGKVRESCESTVVYFMTGFIPGLLLLLNMSPVLNRPISPPSQLRLGVKLIVLATYCDQFHSDTLWEVFLKSKSFYQMGKLKPIALA